MANKLTGRVLSISPTISIPAKSGNVFNKRELILDCTRFDPYTGERGFLNTPKLEFVQNNCSLLDSVNVGDVITVYIDINGNSYTNKEGREDVITTVRGYKVEPHATQQVRQQPQPAPQAIPQPQYAPPQYQPVPQPPTYPHTYDGRPLPPPPAGKDGLPF